MVVKIQHHPLRFGDIHSIHEDALGLKVLLEHGREPTPDLTYIRKGEGARGRHIINRTIICTATIGAGLEHQVSFNAFGLGLIIIFSGRELQVNFPYRLNFLRVGNTLGKLARDGAAPFPPPHFQCIGSAECDRPNADLGNLFVNSILECAEERRHEFVRGVLHVWI